MLRNADKKLSSVAEAWERMVHTELREAPRRMNTILSLEVHIHHTLEEAWNGGLKYECVDVCDVGAKCMLLNNGGKGSAIAAFYKHFSDALKKARS